MSAVTSTPGGSLRVGDLLRSWRRRRSLSQLELALGAGYAPAYPEVAVEAFYPANARTAMRLLGDIGAVMAPGEVPET
jgi:hypothetical protein